MVTRIRRLHGTPFLLLLLAALMLLGFKTWQRSSDAGQGRLSARVAQKAFERARPSLVSRLQGEVEWTFDLPPGTQAVRWITNAELMPGTLTSEGDQPAVFSYATELRLDDGPAKVFHQLSRASFDPLLDWPVSFYEGSETTVLDSRVDRLGDVGEVSQISIRLRAESPVEGTALRMYARQELSAQEQEKRWRRLTPEAKRRLARDNVYPLSLLTAAEKSQALRFRWVPLAPRTAVQRDRLYTLPQEPAPRKARRSQPAPETARNVYTAGPDGLEWQLLGEPQPTPWRIETWNVDRPGLLEWELLGADDERLAAGEIKPPARRYLNAVAGAKRLRLRSENAVHVVVSNRPADLPIALRAPALAGPPERFWFPVAPVDGEESRRALGEWRSAAASSSSLNWESLRPAGAWRAREFLVVKSEPVPAFSFRAIPAGEAVRLYSLPEETVPELLYVRSSDEPFALKIHLGDGEVLRRQLGGRRGTVALTELADLREIRIESSDGGAAWWLSYAMKHTAEEAARDDVRTRRLALRLDEPLTVEVDKRSWNEEVVSVRLFAPLERKEPTRLDVRILGAGTASGPSEDWTLPHRIYEVWPVPDETAIGLDKDRLWLGGGRTVGVRLGRDLPPGRYGLRLESLSDDESFVTVSRPLS